MQLAYSVSLKALSPNSDSLAKAPLIASLAGGSSIGGKTLRLGLRRTAACRRQSRGIRMLTLHYIACGCIGGDGAYNNGIESISPKFAGIYHHDR